MVAKRYKLKPKGKIEKTKPVVVVKLSDEVVGLLGEFNEAQREAMRKYGKYWMFGVAKLKKYLRLASVGNKKMIKFYLEKEDPDWIKILHPLLLAEYNPV